LLECLWIGRRSRARHDKRTLAPLLHRDSFADRHDPIRIFERQSAQNDGVDDGEDRGRCADAQRQHQQRGGREAWRRSQSAPRLL